MSPQVIVEEIQKCQRSDLAHGKVWMLARIPPKLSSMRGNCHPSSLYFWQVIPSLGKTEYQNKKI